MVNLRTDRLEIRQLPPEEAKRVAAYYTENRDFLYPWSPHRDPAFYTPAYHAEVLSRPADRELRLYLFELHSPAICGDIALSNIIRGAFHSCFLGYNILGQMQGRGYMTEGLRAVIQYAFGEMRLHRIQANVIPRNEASVRVLEKLGFEREGRHPKYLKICGKWEDHLSFALLNDNF